jgi:hypothetical protein
MAYMDEMYTCKFDDHLLAEVMMMMINQSSDDECFRGTASSRITGDTVEQVVEL